ncbi:MAG: Gfo/Idh/MocA family oxidoreductase [Acidobacteriota bacterium]|nr:Gfo/Idh/MocA family oxidoreductase [Acidobacteriota bacterium]
MAQNGISRRYFFYGSLLAGAVPAAGFGSKGSLKALGYKSPNEKLNIASIGAGGKAASDIRGCAQTENIVALCDVDEVRAKSIYEQYTKAPKYKDFRQMLDKEGSNIDAVIVTIPDHMHAAAAVHAMERGKHVYVQKPLAHTVWECRQLQETAAKYKVASQMGNQGYSNEGTRQCAEMIWAGEIGNVTEVHAWTNRPIWPQGIQEIPPPSPIPSTLDWDLWLGVASQREYSDKYLPFFWRGFFDFGCGALGDMACHILGASNLALKLGAPTSVECIQQEGRSKYYYPAKSVIRFDFPARGPMPPVKIFWHDGLKEQPDIPGVPKGEILGDLPRRRMAGQRPGTGGAGGPRGSDGHPIEPRENQIIGQVFHESFFDQPAEEAPADRAPSAAAPAGDANAKLDAQANRLASIGSNGSLFVGDKGMITTGTYGENTRLIPVEKMRGYEFPREFLTRSPGHYRDWIRAAKGGDPACSNFNVSAPFTEWVTLGVMALRFEGKLDWDSERMKITNNPEANKLIRPQFRKGWTLG